MKKDLEILEEIKRGEYKRSARKLYNYYPAVKKFVLGNSGSREDAEDVFQEALVIFFKKVRQENFVLTSALNTYLFGIARYLWFDTLKKRKPQEVSEAFVIDGDDIGLAWEEERKAQRAMDAVALLGEKCRQLLLLFYFKEQSMATIASVLGFSSEKLARNQKYRCLEKAKEIYKTLN